VTEDAERPAPAPLPDLVAYKVVACDFCGHGMLGVHCKLKCERCGFVRDCSDP
jgi:hypothetical protein